MQDQRHHDGHDALAMPHDHGNLPTHGCNAAADGDQRERRAAANPRRVSRPRAPAYPENHLIALATVAM